MLAMLYVNRVNTALRNVSIVFLANVNVVNYAMT